MEILDPLSVNLSHRILIEASAGTGKTYTIIQFYLRLLLGIANENARYFSVHEILVVTFTDAATQELKNRLQKQIHLLRIACEFGETDESIRAIYEQITDKKIAKNYLLKAEQSIDKAAIFTIHGFCQRILTNFSFEANLPFVRSFIENEANLKEETIFDVWRRYFYLLPSKISTQVFCCFRDPILLLNEFSNYFPNFNELNIDNNLVLSSNDFELILTEKIEKNTLIFNKLKENWLNYFNEFEEIISNSDVNKRIYNKRNIKNWIDKITNWAKDKHNFVIPDELNRFSSLILNENSTENPPTHFLFDEISIELTEITDLKSLILSLIFPIFCLTFNEKKKKKQFFDYDDLLIQTKIALENPDFGKHLASSICEDFPVAMIDEFQDTDPIQFAIFDSIYPKDESGILILIGDPKQAIYGFRGADIFTYILAKSTCEKQFTLQTNWRSSSNLVHSLNSLFSCVKNPFLFEQIPYFQVDFAEKNQNLSFFLNKKLCDPLQFFVVENEAINQSNYLKIQAEKCAEEIQIWLNFAKKYQAWLNNSSVCRLLEAKDIAILVRNKQEAELIKNSLNKRNIQAVFLSNRQNVFLTNEARDIFRILRAALMPEQSQFLRSALASSVFSLDLMALNNDEKMWNLFVDRFFNYKKIWKNQGILPMFRVLMRDFDLVERFFLHELGERKLTDFLHLTELLQAQAMHENSEFSLFNWFYKQMLSPDLNAKNQQQRLESEKNLIQIMTIHKSKGLEFPIIFLPFIFAFKSSNDKFYYDRKNFQRKYVFSPNENEQILIEEERLAEDLRLLYVALTRAIFHCSIGIAAISLAKNEFTETHKNALGFLLQQKNAFELPQFFELFNNIKFAKTLFFSPEQISNQKFIDENLIEPSIFIKKFSRKFDKKWEVKSFSQLTKNYSVHFFEKIKKFEIELDNLSEFSPYLFPAGKKVGTVLHSLLNKFPHYIDENHVDFDQTLRTLSIDENWRKPLFNWLRKIYKTMLNPLNLTLTEIMVGMHFTEFQFLLALKNTIYFDDFNRIIQKYDPISAHAKPIEFDDFHGFLSGIMDLVFCENERFYILDYKSNWLGNLPKDYENSALINEMILHRYDIQYQLYLLALHRFLRLRIPNYDYETHFGGIFYFFIRGLENENHGIFFHKPNKQLIEELDQLFEF